jgi:organic radical activating enzyme
MRYGIPVTYECNWSCSYCIADTHEHERSFEEALKIAESIEANQKVSLSGGEPGLLTTEQLLQIVDLLKEKGCRVSILSNGTIFNHPEVVSKVDKITYHCSADMSLDDVVNREYPEKTEYLVVVADDNMDNLEPFLDKHSDLDILVYGAKRALSRANAVKIAVQCKDKMPYESVMFLLDSDYQNKIEII